MKISKIFIASAILGVGMLTITSCRDKNTANERDSYGSPDVDNYDNRINENEHDRNSTDYYREENQNTTTESTRSNDHMIDDSDPTRDTMNNNR